MGPEDLRPVNLMSKLMVGYVKINNDDPAKLRRCRVFIPELHEGFEDADLPWFAPIRDIFRGAQPGAGKFNVPSVGSKVLCIFDQGDKNSGFILGELEDGGSAIGGLADANYPFSYGFVDEHGTSFAVNTVAGTATFTHKAATVSIDSGGNVTIDTPADLIVNAAGNATVDAAVINLKGGGGAALGVVQQNCMCAFTKLPHPQVSSTVKAAI